MADQRQKKPSEIIRRGYLPEELDNIYALGVSYLEEGDTASALTIFTGLVEVSEHEPALLGLAYISFYNEEYREVIKFASRVLKTQSESVEALLFIVAASNCLNDYAQAGTCLGEVKELYEKGKINDPDIIRLYRSQFARYNNRRS